MTVWFTSDHHFGHKRILEIAQRPFSSVEEMDEAMIGRWNDVVSRSDLVYHLGDFAFAEHDPYLDRLNGQKHLILGNHDHSNRWKKARGWATVDTLRHIKHEGEPAPITLCHYGLRVWNRSHYGSLHFYGHSHGSLPGDHQSCDVGVDCWDFQPVTLDIIKKTVLRRHPKRREPDHHQPRVEPAVETGIAK